MREEELNLTDADFEEMRSEMEEEAKAVDITLSPSEDEERVEVYINGAFIESGPFMFRIPALSAIMLSKTISNDQKFSRMIEDGIRRKFPQVYELFAWEDSTAPINKFIVAWAEISQKKAEAEAQARDARSQKR